MVVVEIHFHYLNLEIRCRFVVSFTLQPLNPGILRTAGRTDPRTSQDAAVKRKMLPLSGIEHLSPGRSAHSLSHIINSILTLHLDHQSGLFPSNFPTKYFSSSFIAICVLNARYTNLILFDETQRNVCKNLRTECALEREFRDAGTLLFLLDFLCVASVFQDPAYKWNLSYRNPRQPTSSSRRLYGSHLSFRSLDVRTYPDT